MRIVRSDLAACRAVIAVAALYALALQTLLSGMIGVPPVDPAHILCLQDAAAEGRPDSAPPVHVHLSCCTAAHVAPSLDAPVLAAAIVWPVRRIAVTRWRPEIVATPRAPPGISASARAPPVV
ncbi:hypothetical protein [Methylobacterium sp. J-068]|uniref:hypothetical protein n=1 Tax=Methylobacterium sp. J-068 TaxID=2836649 RepID=UPI001FB8DBC6|nr:hypothetical protein [Methylobacterium sp. J-068]MCJ2033233.1 hypothetical protein [Methylobacterium sp. J-068]